MTTPSQRALILYRPRRFINHLLTNLLTLVSTAMSPDRGDVGCEVTPSECEIVLSW